jgi:hypothetical protein
MYGSIFHWAYHNASRSKALILICNAESLQVGDRKYIKPGDPTNEAELFLLSNSCPPAYAAKVQKIVQHVSYSSEIKDPVSYPYLVIGGHRERESTAQFHHGLET